MLKLIINADDFGHSEKINLAVIECFRNGILRSASLMANGKSFDHAVGIVRSNPDLDIGVHLSLVGGMPLLGSAESHSLLKDERYFHKNAVDFAKIYFSGKISLQEVKAEWTAQIEKLLDYGIKISHIDSHQHLHILPRILDIATELANRYKIKFIRLPRESFKQYMLRDWGSSFRSLAQMSVLNYFCSKSRGKTFYKTDHFMGFYFGGKLSKQNMLTLVNNLPLNGTCELMCHPGFEQFTDDSTSQYRKVEETIALTDQDVAKLIGSKNITISSFKNLAH